MAEGRPATLAEVLIAPLGPDAFVAGNPAWRSWVVGDLEFVALLGALRSPDAPLPPGPFRATDATISPFTDGLLGDPTGLDRAIAAPESEPLDLDVALELARRRALVADDEAAYTDGLEPRRNILDRARRGTIHQRVGEHVLLERRLRSVDEWWASQKFTDDRTGARDGLYRTIQWPFMDAFFGEERLAGRDVLDFGCGPGLFSRLFAARGATVLALDTNDDHLETARALADDDGLAERLTFEELSLPVEDSLARLGERRFDLIFLSDVLMFYFAPYDTDADLDPAALLSSLTELLAEDGRIVVLEPNGTFWQRPWLGDPLRPMTVLTEHHTRRHGVTPSLEEVSRAAEAAGLAIQRAREVVPPPELVGDRATRFAAEFPLWWCFELARAARA